MTWRALAYAPVVVPQALWVAARAARLPEAAGPRQGVTGQGPGARVLVLGDSSAAGVGVRTQDQALGGRLAAEMAVRRRVDWTVLAKSGGTVRSTTALLETLGEAQFDGVVVALGVNDAKNRVSLRAWRDGYVALLDRLAVGFGARVICVSGLPPVRQFPLLPAPLNAVLGERAERFDQDLRAIAEARRDTHYLPLTFTMDTAQMAEDGFHPGPQVYAEWARRVAAVFERAGL
ncbi:MAG: SGNH/GDSL hydrolase family protein [Pseudomonadota bacterium]